MSGSILFRVLFRGEEMHRKTLRAMTLVAFGGAFFGTIRPGEPWEHVAVKVALSAVLIVGGLRMHPGAETVSRDWVEYEELDPDG